MSSSVPNNPRITFLNKDTLLIIENGQFNVRPDLAFDNLLAFTIRAGKNATEVKPFTQITNKNFYKYLLNSESYIIKSSTDTSTLFIRNISNNIMRKFPFKIDNFEWLCNDGDYVIVQTKNDKKIWFFNVSSGEQMQVSTVLSNDIPTYELYISSDNKTVKLIEWSEKTLSIYTILGNGINYAVIGTLPVDTYTDKGRGFESIDIVDGILQVQLRDESYILLFLVGRKNKFPYLAQKIYPPLSITERVLYGLGKK